MKTELTVFKFGVLSEQERIKGAPWVWGEGQPYRMGKARRATLEVGGWVTLSQP